jgi:hypothetical protein
MPTREPAFASNSSKKTTHKERTEGEEPTTPGHRLKGTWKKAGDERKYGRKRDRQCP